MARTVIAKRRAVPRRGRESPLKRARRGVEEPVTRRDVAHAFLEAAAQGNLGALGQLHAAHGDTLREVRDPDGMMALHAAVTCQNGAAVAQLVAWGHDVFAEDAIGRSATYYAGYGADLEVLLEIFMGVGSRGLAAFAHAFDGMVAGATACGKDTAHAQTLEQLLNRTGVRLRDVDESLVLRLAELRHFGLLVCVLARVPHAARVQDADRGWTLLHFAVDARDAAAARGLLDVAGGYAAELLSARDHRGYCALHVAVGAADEDMARLLLQRGAPADDAIMQRGATEVEEPDLGTALHTASARGYDGIARLLLAYGANPNREKACGCTPLFFASSAAHASMVAVLLKHGARVDPSERSRAHGAVPAYAVAKRCAETLGEFLRAGACCDLPVGPNDQYPIHAAAVSGNVPACEVLVAHHGFRVLKRCNSFGVTPLDAVRELLDRHAGEIMDTQRRLDKECYPCHAEHLEAKERLAFLERESIKLGNAATWLCRRVLPEPVHELLLCVDLVLAGRASIAPTGGHRLVGGLQILAEASLPLEVRRLVIAFGF